MIRTYQIAARVLLASTVLATPAMAALGGGDVRMTGSGDNVALERHGPAPSQAGRRTMIAGGTGDGPEVIYLDPAPAGEPAPVGRLLGSREDAQVIYQDEEAPAALAPRG